MAGMAAAVAARLDDPYSVCIHDKRVEVYVNSQYRDMALIDAVISDDNIWAPGHMGSPAHEAYHRNPAAIPPP